MVRYHGLYVGPNWSEGKEQPSVAGTTPGIDEFDETGREHDRAYANKEDLQAADFKFAKQNIGRGIKRTAAGLAVGAQGVARFVTPQKRKRFRSKDISPGDIAKKKIKFEGTSLYNLLCPCYKEESMKK